MESLLVQHLVSHWDSLLVQHVVSHWDSLLVHELKAVSRIDVTVGSMERLHRWLSGEPRTWLI